MIIKYLYIPFLIVIAAFLYYIAIYRIYPFEFDTTVYFVLLESLFRTGKVLMPIATGELPYICDIDFNCSFSHPDTAGQQLFAQMPPDYTSGISLLFIPALINKIIYLFYNSKYSILYFIQIYSLSAALIYFLSSFLIIKYSKINWSEQIIYILISFVSQILITPYAANAIIGELYASVIISNVAIGLAITLTKEHSRAFYYICALFLGIALEAKISSIFPVGAIFSVLVIKSILQKKRLLDICILILIISLAKIVAIIYYFSIFNFNVDNLFTYFNSISGVYLYNAGAGIGWGSTSVIKQLSMIFINEKVNIIIYIGIICYGISFAFAVKTNNNILLAFIFYVIRGGSGWLDSIGPFLSGAWRIADYAAVCRVVRWS